MVHQHFQLVPVFTVAENIVMGTEPTRFPFSWKTMGMAGGVTAALFLIGGLITGLGLEAVWKGLIAGAAVAGLYGLVTLLAC